MHTDASGSAVAAALGQVHDGKVERPVAFASQKLSGSQLGWAIIEKEAYAIIWALNRFRDIVYGAHITVFCRAALTGKHDTLVRRAPGWQGAPDGQQAKN